MTSRQTAAPLSLSRRYRLRRRISSMLVGRALWLYARERQRATALHGSYCYAPRDGLGGIA
jgi:hypothetical protein